MAALGLALFTRAGPHVGGVLAVQPRRRGPGRAGVLDGRRAAWFGGLQISGQGEETVIRGQVADQPALHGLLTKVRDLGLCLLSVRRLDTSQAEDKAPRPGLAPAEARPFRHRPPPRALSQDSRPERDYQQTWRKT
jgi:hypothetical protein